jgi:hypothetical protein
MPFVRNKIFLKDWWFAYTNNFANWHVLKIEQVREIIAENKEKRKVASLEDFALEVVVEPQKDFNNAMGQESLTRFDQPKRKKKSNKKRKPAENLIVANANVAPNANVSTKTPNANANANANPNRNNNPNANKNANANKNNPIRNPNNKIVANQNKPATANKPVDNKIIPNKKNETKE